MPRLAYDRATTALLLVDSYNDFISEGGKLWGRIRAVAEANDWVANMLQVLNAAQKAKPSGLLVVKDATADYSDEHMHAALDVNMPSYASAIGTAKEVVESILPLQYALERS